MKKILTAVSVITSLVLVWIFWQPIVTSLVWISDREALTESVQRMGIWGPVVLFILLVLQVFLAFIPGQALMITCAYLYGFWGGWLISWVSLVAGGEAAFMLARRYGRPFAERWIDTATLSRWDKTAVGQGIVFYTLAMILPIFPNDAMCYVGGLANITPRRFLFANMLGRGFTCLLSSFVGVFGSQIPMWGWVLAAAIVLVLCIGWFINKRYFPNESHLLKIEPQVPNC